MIITLYILLKDEDREVEREKILLSKVSSPLYPLDNKSIVGVTLV